MKTKSIARRALREAHVDVNHLANIGYSSSQKGSKRGKNFPAYPDYIVGRVTNVDDLLADIAYGAENGRESHHSFTLVQPSYNPDPKQVLAIYGTIGDKPGTKVEIVVDKMQGGPNTYRRLPGVFTVVSVEPATKETLTNHGINKRNVYHFD